MYSIHCVRQNIPSKPYFCGPKFTEVSEMIDKLALHAEALIFAAEKPISIEDIISTLEETLELILEPNAVLDAVNKIVDKYSSDDYAIEIVEISGGYSFMSKGAYHLTITQYLKQTTTKRLSKAAMEALAIIAYKQPVSKTEIESIRGVNCDYAVQKLLDKELVEIKGRSESVGKPLLYGTSQKFFDYFGLKGMNDLPKLKEFEMAEESIGVAIEEREVDVMLDGEKVHVNTEVEIFDLDKEEE